VRAKVPVGSRCIYPGLQPGTNIQIDVGALALTKTGIHTQWLNYALGRSIPGARDPLSMMFLRI